MEAASDRLTLRQIAAEMGDEIAHLLVDGFRGTRVYIPLQPDEQNPLVRVLGGERAHALSRRFGGEAIDIPLFKSRGQRRDDAAVIMQLRRTGLSVAEIARRIGCSERHVYHVLARRDSA